MFVKRNISIISIKFNTNEYNYEMRKEMEIKGGK
jgi:hypothetical protein